MLLQIHPEFSRAIGKVLQKNFGLNLQNSKELAQAVLKLSDFYNQKPGQPTPWDQDWCTIANLVYYAPLNSLRMQTVWSRFNQNVFWKSLPNLPVVDWGSGLGAATWQMPEGWPAREIVNFEISGRAQDLHRSLTAEGLKPKGSTQSWVRLERELPRQFVAMLSYSLVEKCTTPEWLSHAEALIVLEPSTQLQSRELLQKRQTWLDQGFSVWAPCTHQGACPLLQSAQQDWCHDRVHVDLPDWFLAIEERLPMRNRTITFSYLVLAKKPGPQLGDVARLTGDLRVEKGKSRQMVCHSSEREFLAWLHREGQAPELPRGSLIRWPQSSPRKSQEIRVQETLELVDTIELVDTTNPEQPKQKS